jgi:hypothetical protein
MTGTGSGSSGSGSEIATGPKNATAGKGNLTIIRSGLLLASNGAAEGATETDMTVTTSYSEHDLVEYGLYPNNNGWFDKPGRREDLLSNFGTDIASALGVSRSAVKVNSIEGKKVVITMGPGAGGRPGFTYTNPSGEKEDKYVQSHPTAASLTPKGFGPLKIHFHVSGVTRTSELWAQGLKDAAWTELNSNLSDEQTAVTTTAVSGDGVSTVFESARR